MTPADDLKAAARRLAVGLWAGLASGALFGGIGGRLAMFVLRLTSDPSLRGTETDDGFVIGEFTAATFFLILLGAGVGMAGGILYLVVRNWLPQRGRPAVFGVIAGLVGGSQIIHPGGIDFTLLEPIVLAIVMFVALPAAYGVATSWLVERSFARDSEDAAERSWVAVLLPLLGGLLAGPTGAAVVVLGLAVWAIGRQIPIVGRAWGSRWMLWAGRIVLAALSVRASTELVSDIVAIA